MNHELALKELKARFNPFYFLDDEDLSWEAKGFFAYLRNASNSECLTIEELLKMKGKGDTDKILKELEEKGYLTQESAPFRWVLKKH